MITVFDIETHEIPENEWEKFIPEKIGNITDPVKVREKFKEKLALHAKTAYIACIGYDDGKRKNIYCNNKPILGTNFCDSEKDLIYNFYFRVSELTKTNLLVGHNCYNFDLPFIVQRGLIHGIKPPVGLRNHRYWNDNIKDTMTEWTCDSYGEYIGLGELAELFKVGTKDKKGGAKFPELWDYDPERDIEYLRNDLELTYQIAEKMF